MAGIIERSIAPLAPFALIAFALIACGEAPNVAAAPRAPAPVIAALPAPVPAALPASPQTTLVVTRNSVAFAGAPSSIYSLPADASGGADVAFKAHGPGDYFIVPLGEALAAERAASRLGESIGVVVDPETTYRVLIEVLFTAGQNGSSHYVIRESVSPRTLLADAPTMQGPQPSPGLHLTAILLADGVSLKTFAGDVAPGCSGLGAGLASPRIGGLIDLAGMRACAARVKAAYADGAHENSVTIVASSRIVAREIFDVADALRGSRAELFPKIQFGLTN